MANRESLASSWAVNPRAQAVEVNQDASHRPCDTEFRLMAKSTKPELLNRSRQTSGMGTTHVPMQNSG